MSKQVSITLDDEILAFVDRMTSDRSKFINELLRKEKHRALIKDLEEAYIEEANDPVLKAERNLWEITVGDGLDI